MRIAKTVGEEKYVVCPECKRLLAYIEHDVESVVKITNNTFKVSRYIECPICGYSNLIDYKEYER